MTAPPGYRAVRRTFRIEPEGEIKKGDLIALNRRLRGLPPYPDGPDTSSDGWRDRPMSSTAP